MKIAYILPRGMSFSENGATSIDLVVRDQVLNSKFRDDSTVIGQTISKPFAGLKYLGIEGTNQRQRNNGYLACVRSQLPDIVVVHQYPNTASFLARKLPDIPIVLYRHGLFRPRTGWLTKQLKKNQFRPIAAMVFVSRFIQSKFLQDYPQFRERNIVINNAIDTEVWKPASQKENRICFAGRARQDKGILELIEGYRNLPKTNWKLELILAVTNKTEREFYERVHQLVATEKTINLHSNIPTENVRDAFARAKIAVLPSIVSEGFPRTVVEALATGCVTIATRSGGTPEAVGSVGILLEYATPIAIRESLNSLIKQPDKLESLSKKSRDHAVKHLNIKLQIAQLDDFIERMVATFKAT